MMLFCAVFAVVLAGLASGKPTGGDNQFPGTYQYTQFLAYPYAPQHIPYPQNLPLQLQPLHHVPVQQPQPVRTATKELPEEEYTIVNQEWGKANVKLLYVAKEGNKHSIKELEVRTALTLNTEKEYRVGDNSDIIATDSQKNTVNIFAKKHGVGSPEQFGIRLANHFLNQYPKLTRAEIQINEKPWQRIQDHQGRQHSHAFVNNPTSTRYAEVELDRSGQLRVSAGIRGLTVLKTTQSGFVDFVSDEYRSLPDMADRVVSTVVTADWTYSDVNGLDFDNAWREIQDIILNEFAGPVDTGVYSSSVQYTQHLMQKAILDTFPQVESVTIDMPNRHYFAIDFSKFPIEEVQGEGAGEVLLPVDNPAGFITSTLVREDTI